LSAPNPQSDAEQLDAAADQAIAACGGDARELLGLTGARNPTVRSNMARWVYRTRAGLAQIVPDRGGGFMLIFDDEALEHHASPGAAAEALANGTSFWPSAGDPSRLGIPEDISDWTFVS
jgi:hypothetical protein